ncbi:putative 2OG-Fe(II) oxygenase [Gammaproteobacteria bacterium AB-CW1]|uniref:2OG-Fe(II) oxygenase n=2 Tax=Natronospira TaxID=2024969 RepID=A0AAP6MKW2_9GAMM|nr:putative 2OG-Fe(II) oxygenase [Gammaproteobacteria bacterium AB-CW1]
MSQQDPFKPEIRAAFASPLVRYRGLMSDQERETLREMFIREASDPARGNAVLPGTVTREVFESEWDLFERDEPLLQRLREYCLGGTLRAIRDINRYSQEQMAQVRLRAQAWFHVTRGAGFAAPHNHPMASWSGVFCVDPGDRDSEFQHNGVLRFFDPRTGSNMYMDAGNAQPQGVFAVGSQNFVLESGDLILFPSYLLHEAAPYFGERERITVAFNVQTQGLVDFHL